MNILITCFSKSWGGLEIQALELAVAIHARYGHAAWLACLPDSRLEQEAAASNIPTYVFDVTGYVHPTVVFRLAKAIARNHIDIIHCQLSKDIATVVPAVKLSMADVPIVLTRSMGSYISKKDPLHQFTYGNVALVLAVSSVIHENVIATTPMQPERVLTFPYGVDTVAYDPSRTHGQSVRKDLGYTDGTVVVGCVGRISPGKGHQELLAAASQLRSAFPHVRYLFVGEASYGEQDYAAQVMNLRQSLGVNDITQFTGFRRDIPEVMAALDVFAFPSHAEAFGLVLIEAMAMARPVVSSNCDGVLDIVVDGETGIMVPPRDPEALAGALRVLLKDPSLRARMGNAGRARVLVRFEKRRLFDELLGIYASLLRGEIPSR